jgi:hypothetical protein
MEKVLAILCLFGCLSSFGMENPKCETKPREGDKEKQYQSETEIVFLWRMILEGKNPSVPTREQRQRKEWKYEIVGDFAGTDG